MLYFSDNHRYQLNKAFAVVRTKGCVSIIGTDLRKLPAHDMAKQIANDMKLGHAGDTKEEDKEKRKYAKEIKEYVIKFMSTK